MKNCYYCLAIDYLTRFNERYVCEKCMIFVDFEEFEECHTESPSPSQSLGLDPDPREEGD